ncbi:hypothetical protein IFM89_009615 [Coptis chinensis]|uniref:Reverse transcriptase domain-containing protein n=1 Tax=Coptis chinensis TaxID=261450 RepID=A0A835IY27_9MAGN|nr:hypothetical protein IFM89_009615 [Coptis chinensis]
MNSPLTNPQEFPPLINDGGRRQSSAENEPPAVRAEACEAALNQHKSWSSLFNKGKAVAFNILKKHNPEFINGVNVIPKEIIENGYLTKKWRIKGDFNMIADSDLFYFKFTNAEDKLSVMEARPVYMDGNCFIVTPWTQDVERRKTIKGIPIWVNLFDVPRELWSEEGLGVVASSLGKPLLMDEATASRRRIAFARVCVEIEISSELPKDFEIEMEKGNVRIRTVWVPRRRVLAIDSVTETEIGNRETRDEEIENLEGENHERRSEMEIPAQISTGQEENRETRDSSPRTDMGERDGTLVDSNQPFEAEGERVEGDQVEGVVNVEVVELALVSYVEVVGCALMTAEPVLLSEFEEAQFGFDSLPEDIREGGSTEDDVVSVEETPYFSDKTEGVLAIMDTPRQQKDIHMAKESKSRGDKELPSNEKQSHKQSSVPISVWNVRGINDLHKAAEINKVRVDKKISIFGLLETKNMGMLGPASGVCSKTEGVRSVYPLTVQGPWCVAGDFNNILESNEIVGGDPMHPREVYDFSLCLQNSRLTDINSIGFFFTWWNKSVGIGSIMSRIDRYLVNKAWYTAYPYFFAEFLPYGISNHSPMLLSWSDYKRKAPPFRFCNYWALPGEFKCILEEVWKTHIYNNPMYVLVEKLKILKQKVKPWDRANFSHLHERVEAAKQELHDAQILLQSSLGNTVLGDRERFCMDRYNTLARAEAMDMAQKSKGMWTKDGDKCTKYFFSCIKEKVSRRVSNAEFFLNLKIRNGISEPMARNLEVEITDEEVKVALFDMDYNKVPGSDGFNPFFFKDSWEIVGKDFTRAVKNFFGSNKLPRAVNATFLCLIPKVDNPTKVEDFRPIALCNTICKCVTKVITNRLKICINDLVHLNQSAFTPDRYIQDNILLSHELLRGYEQKHGTPRCSVKLDIRKAYDMVSWETIEFMMERFGFPEKFRKWIKLCISSPTFSVLVNGDPEVFFQGKRRLRQEDPMSPYLFVLVMEIFKSIVKEKIEAKQIKYHSKCKKIRLSHLAFADDVLFFCRGEAESIRSLKECIEVFGHKTTLMTGSISVYEAQELATILEVELVRPPVRYLGLPLFAGRLGIKECQPLVDRVTAKLKDWKARMLSHAGRLQLILSVLTAMPIYWYRTFIIPKTVIEQIEKVCARFLWSGVEIKRCHHQASFSTLCKSKEEGGLGIMNMGLWNKGAYCGLVYRIAAREESVWVNIANGESTLLWHDIWCPLSLLIHNAQAAAELHLPLDVGIKTALDIKSDTRSSNREWSSLLKLCKRKEKIGEIYKASICTAVDAIWKERNARRFKNSSKPVPVVLGRIMRDMRTYIQTQVYVMPDTAESRVLCQRIGIQTQFKTLERKWCRWHAPAEPRIKLNADGALTPLGTGHGGLIRDSKGVVIEAFTGSGGMQSVIFQELKAIEIGMIKCRALEVQEVEIKSDYLWAIQIIKRVVDIPWYCLNIATHIQELVTNFVFCTFSHVYRECNKPADLLAGLSISNCISCMHHWNPLSRKLHKLVEDDPMGKMYERV